ncbi:hypothetical protein PR202_gb25977 [Eleusine coracana subsp. coracana]|uniref:PIR2-like helical domain-containing protein n=1 Tax=Eleusine coracana subsp. coracana TaxID=191504 RepID=A0AAV5FQN9_ELECO|nr:hypothetical protein PR202_gb25977 [Eleusine coracana subsp. coracana]
MPEDLAHPCYSQPLQLAALRYENATKKTKVQELPSRALVKCTEQRKKRRKAKNVRYRYFAECMKQIAKRMKKKRKMKKCIIENRNVNPSFRYTLALKLLLLDKIHAHYLEALARLPGDALRNRYYAGLLRAGFCYGPMDPISNIILNTVWYAITFPTPSDFEVSMICTKLLRCVECGSLYGLVAFLRALFHTLTEHDAVWLLLLSNIDAALAITMAQQRGHVMSGAYSDAYRKAALDSWHPADPDALSNVATLLQQMDFGELSSLLNGHGPLCTHGIEKLVLSLPTKFDKVEEQVSHLNQAEILSVIQKSFISEIRKKLQADQEFFARKANTALNTYAMKNGFSIFLYFILFYF